MKAFTKTSYGGPEILRLEDVDKPVLKPGHLLIRVMANSANPADWHLIRGKPYFARLTSGLIRPKVKIPGADFAGVVEAVEDGVTGYTVGDRVFGEMLLGGAFAEYACVPANVCAHMPQTADFATMACVPIAGITALQAIVTHGKVQPGESVLINGASGGVGHFAVQVAKAHGAIVTGVCSARNADFVKTLGADHVIAYDREDIHAHAGTYDLVVDTNGNLTYADFTRMGRRGVLTGFTTMGHMMSVLLRKSFGKFPLAQFTAEANSKDLQTLAGLVKAGEVTVHIEKTFPFEKIPEAIGYIEAMRTRGKVAMVGGGAD
jgi:NADPH:quinone reductase-like Zn-dependent oxidoreductase